MRAGLWAGWIAGVVDHAVLIAAMLAYGLSPWIHARATAAMVLGPGVLQENSPRVFLAAVAVHFALSLVYGVVVARLVRGRGWGAAIAIGAGFGLAVWMVNYYVISPLAFPWLVPNGTLPGMPFAHLVLGVTAAACYLRLRALRIMATP